MGLSAWSGRATKEEEWKKCDDGGPLACLWSSSFSHYELHPQRHTTIQASSSSSSSLSRLPAPAAPAARGLMACGSAKQQYHASSTACSTQPAHHSHHRGMPPSRHGTTLLVVCKHSLFLSLPFFPRTQGASAKRPGQALEHPERQEAKSSSSH